MRASLLSPLRTPDVKNFPDFLKKVESKWKVNLQRRFERERFVGGKNDNPNSVRYILAMFPYPSGRLHLGHVRIYTSGDILARYSKLMSRNDKAGFKHVIYPMGFDSFGLPAENAAKERNLNPAVWTNSNIRVMKQQLDDMAFQFDWREATSNPSFYKWTQDLFLKLMDAGLVYKSFAQVNWDPVDKTVLADEQVDEEGRSWRSGTLVEKRNYRQWFIKVNAFTKNIYEAEDIDPDSWRDILTIQRNWIGQPSGWLFYLPVSNDSEIPDILPVFTKNPELFLSKHTELLISNDHWLEKVHQISQTSSLNNPFTGMSMKVSVTKEVDELPASGHATLKSNNMIQDSSTEEDRLSREQVLCFSKLHNLGGYYTSDKYRDWLVSRQRFWGTPIPVLQCSSCGYKGAPRESLPITLPKVENLIKQSTKKDINQNEDQLITPIEELAPRDWLETQCSSCGSTAKRECETFDTLFDSSWYFLRYASKPSTEGPFDSVNVQPVWCYIGGKEHASMHLFYARFISHFLNSQGFLNFKEPFKKLLVQGIVKSKTYRLKGRYLSPSEIESVGNDKDLNVEYEKMSKSKGNGVDPQKLLDTYGIDATRFCLMSYANPRTERLWRSQDEEFKDVLLYLRRVTLTVQNYVSIGSDFGEKSSNNIKELSGEELKSSKSFLRETRNRSSIDAIYYMEETNQFRQYISTLHVILNSLRSNLNSSAVYTREFAETLAALIVMMNPLTPHLSEELWSHFSQCKINPLKNNSNSQYNTSLQSSDQPWPLPDNEYPLHVKVRAINSDEYVAKIKVSKEELNNLDRDGIAKLVISYFNLHNDQCDVYEVRKFDDLMAIVVARIESVDKKIAIKRKQKR